MNKKSLLLAALLTVVGVANAQETPDSASNKGDEEARVVFGTVEDGVRANWTMPASCGAGYEKRVNPRLPVIITGTAVCSRRYSNADVGYWKIAVNGKEYFVRKADVSVSASDAQLVESATAEQAQEAHDVGMAVSKNIRRDMLRKALDKLRATKPSGLAIVENSIYDESEYTEGTSFRATVYNPTNKPIKYVWFTLVGLNAVDDPVLSRGQSSRTMRGIGPVEPDETATWTFKYVWMTDIVQRFRLTQVKVQYADNSIKVISKPASITLSDDVYETLFENRDD